MAKLQGKNFSQMLGKGEDPLGRSTLQVGIEVAIAVLICVACIFGNSLVVIAIHRTPRLNTITNMLVENLAWTDIFMATLHLPIWISSMYSGQWPLGHVACRFVGFSELVFGTASLQTISSKGICTSSIFQTVKQLIWSSLFRGSFLCWSAARRCLAGERSNSAINSPIAPWGGMWTTSPTL